jgi:hypothetical protein
MSWSISQSRVERYRAVTDRHKHCGSLRSCTHFFQATRQKLINCTCSVSSEQLKWVVRSSSNQMHASSNLPSMRTKKVGTLVITLYMYLLCVNIMPPPPVLPFGVSTCYRLTWPKTITTATPWFVIKTLLLCMVRHKKNTCGPTLFFSADPIIFSTRLTVYCQNGVCLSH